MNYVLCNAYQELFFALQLQNSGEDIAVVTYNKDVKKYCTATNIACLYFETIRFNFRLTVRPIRLIRLGMKTLREAVILKSRLDNLIREIKFGEEDRFYLLAKEVSYEGFYLAKELSKKRRGTVYFRNILWRKSKIYKAKFNQRFLEHLVVRYLLRLFWGLKLISYDTNSNPRFGINDNFLKKNKIVKIAPDRDFEELVLDVVKKTKTGQKQCDNLLIGESSVILGVIKYDSIREVYKNLADLPIVFTLKKHPNWRAVNSQIDVLHEELFQDYLLP